MPPRHQYVVAVHDVTPAHSKSLHRLYALLDEIGITRYALLVVPNWHGAWPLERHAGFVEDLLRRQANGAEIFLHGQRHDEVGLRRSWLQHLLVAGRTATSAEFRVAPPDEAARRLDLGLALFHRLGLKPAGFIPPAWLHGPQTLDQLRERGLDITEGFWMIRRVGDGTQRFAPALSWSTRAAWRSHACAWIAGARRLVETPRSLVRVAIHPPDIEVPVVAQSLRRSLARLRTGRRLATYQEALAGNGTENGERKTGNG